jgi:hypothetical protein
MAGSERGVNPPDLKQQFSALIDEYRHNPVRLSSNLRDHASNSAYRAIVALGEQAVPLLLVN